jgi:pyruvate/2-oxoglutarate/acetoin dehydrogenase E1 component
MAYFDQLKLAMNWLAQQQDTYFVGQAVCFPGTAMSNTLKDVPLDRRLELPVFEDTQMGMSLGMALTGKRVISVFPRWNFLLCATNQLVNHVDKFKLMSDGAVAPSLIIRTSVGSERPLFPGHQHIGNFSNAFRSILHNVDVIELQEPGQILPSYQHAYKRADGKSTLLVEFGDFYNEK